MLWYGINKDEDGLIATMDLGWMWCCHCQVVHPPGEARGIAFFSEGEENKVCI